MLLQTPLLSKKFERLFSLLRKGVQVRKLKTENKSCSLKKQWFASFQTLLAVRRLKNKRYYPKHTTPTVKNPSRLMVWGTISTSSPCILWFLPPKATMNGKTGLPISQVAKIYGNKKDYDFSTRWSSMSRFKVSDQIALNYRQLKFTWFQCNKKLLSWVKKES